MLLFVAVLQTLNRISSHASIIKSNFKVTLTSNFKNVKKICHNFKMVIGQYILLQDIF